MNCNKSCLIGTLAGISYSHMYKGEEFYLLHLLVSRLSDKKDVLPIIISKDLLDNFYFEKGDKIIVEGQIRSRRHIEENRNRMSVYCYAFDIYPADFIVSNSRRDDIESMFFNTNLVLLAGHICKTPKYREIKKSSRIITDLLVACNRRYGSDYIPCIVWGPKANAAKRYKIGDKVNIEGRFQSRSFYSNLRKRWEETYEISVSKICKACPSNALPFVEGEDVSCLVGISR